jgi:hypothetical protein
MKRYLLLLLVICSSILAHSQDRQNKKLPKIGIKALGSLTSAKGWLLNPEGQWISRQNRIPVSIENEFKSLIDYQDNALGIDNFISLEFRNVTINDSSFVILIKRYKNGSFKYSSINEGWYNYNEAMYYIINKADYDSLGKGIMKDSINLVQMNYLAWGSVGFIKDQTYISDIEKDIAANVKELKLEEKVKLCFHIAPYTKKNIVQFNIYTLTDYGSFKTVGGVVTINADPKIYGTKALFNQSYYEATGPLFKLFIKY